MTLFKQDCILYKVYPGLSHEAMNKMPYYEYRLKLQIMKELAEEEEEQSNKSSQSYKEQMGNMTSGYKMPDMPKMPDMASLPKISIT